jgi:hypothetical protein
LPGAAMPPQARPKCCIVPSGMRDRRTRHYRLKWWRCILEIDCQPLDRIGWQSGCLRESGRLCIW